MTDCAIDTRAFHVQTSSGIDWLAFTEVACGEGKETTAPLVPLLSFFSRLRLSPFFSLFVDQFGACGKFFSPGSVELGRLVGCPSTLRVFGVYIHLMHGVP